MKRTEDAWICAHLALERLPGRRWFFCAARCLRSSCLSVLFLVGFIAFAETVARAAAPRNPHADAIVVLTGGAAANRRRVAALGRSAAKRLLISGVNPHHVVDIAKTVRRDLRDDLDCCVDLGKEALDTIGNAAETRRWAEERGFSSLIVVTSDYHMPRSMTELAGAMPGDILIPYPVADPQFRLRGMVARPGASRPAGPRIRQVSRRQDPPASCPGRRLRRRLPWST